jgi:hypothetical protein
VKENKPFPLKKSLLSCIKKIHEVKTSKVLMLVASSFSEGVIGHGFTITGLEGVFTLGL